MARFCRFHSNLIFIALIQRPGPDGEQTTLVIAEGLFRGAGLVRGRSAARSADGDFEPGLERTCAREARSPDGGSHARLEVGRPRGAIAVRHLALNDASPQLALAEIVRVRTHKVIGASTAL